MNTEKETLLKVDGGDTLTELFSFQAVGDSQTEDEAGVVSPSVHGCSNTVYALNRFYPYCCCCSAFESLKKIVRNNSR